MSRKKSPFPPGLAALFLLLHPASLLAAGTKVDLKPQITVTQTYEDNLQTGGRKGTADFTTAISPGLRLEQSSRRTDLAGEYVLTLAAYQRNPAFNSIRHRALLDFTHRFNNSVTFDLKEKFLQSEESTETEVQAQTMRPTIAIYRRNSATAGLNWRIDQKNSLALGAGHDLLENDDPHLNDAVEESLFSSFSHTFDGQNDLNLTYRQGTTEFDRDDGSPANDNFSSRDEGLRLTHRFISQTEIWAEYQHTEREFAGQTEDYATHTANLGYKNQLSPSASFDLGSGYYQQDKEESGRTTGIVAFTDLKKDTATSSYRLGGRTGWDEGYLEADTRGLTKYWLISGDMKYQVSRYQSWYANGSYRQNSASGRENFGSLRAQCGVRWQWLRYLAITTEYSYSRNFTETESGQGTNRLTLSLSASDDYKWRY